MSVEHKQEWPSNPREKRAYAHAMIAQAKRNPSDPELINLAQEAVSAAGDSRKSRTSGFENALIPKAVMLNQQSELGTSRPMSEKTGKVLLREIRALSQGGYESKNTGLKIKTLPGLYDNVGRILFGEVTICVQTEPGRAKFPESPYATAILHGKGKQVLHFIYPATAGDWINKFPVATEEFGQRVQQEIRTNLAR